MNKFFLLAIVALTLSCKQEASLQKYFVESGEKKEFMALDVSSSILNINETKLSASEKKALASFDKVNILAFKKDGKNIDAVAQATKHGFIFVLDRLTGTGHMRRGSNGSRLRRWLPSCAEFHGFYLRGC